jgi:hypothetical protein
LPRKDAANLPVFDRRQLLGRDLARGALFPRLLERRRPEQAPDHIGTKRRLLALHLLSSSASHDCRPQQRRVNPCNAEERQCRNDDVCVSSGARASAGASTPSE